MTAAIAVREAGLDIWTVTDERLVERRYARERIVVVTHQAVAMLFRCVIEGLSEAQVLDIDVQTQIANCAIPRYELEGERLALRSLNDVVHLSAFDAVVSPKIVRNILSGQISVNRHTGPSSRRDQSSFGGETQFGRADGDLTVCRLVDILTHRWDWCCLSGLL